MALTRPKYSNIVDGDYKNSCRVATTTNINLISAPLTYDGVTFSKGDRVLVTAQNTGSQNGIYTVLDEGTGSNGTWTRSFDSNDGTRLSGGSQTSTGEGSYAGAIWRLVTPDPIVIGTTPLVWATGSAFAGGANKQVQYNDNGVLAGTPIIQIDEITGNVVIGVGAVQLDSNNSNYGSAVVVGGLAVQKGVSIATHLNVETGPVYANSLNTANARITGGSITGVTGAFITLQVQNFSAANIYQSTTGTLVAENFSSGNIYQSAADTFVVTNLSASNVYQTTAQSIQSPNVQIGTNWGTLSRANLAVGNVASLHATEGNITTLSAPNFSSANIYQVGVGQSIQTANAQIGEDWSDTSRANLAVANVRVLNATTGNVKTLVADNFSSANIYQSAADTFVTSNFSSGNIYQSAAGTLVATNFSSGNIYQSTAGTLVVSNFSTGNLYQSAAGTLVSDNFSSANARIAAGYADNFPIGANTSAPGSFTTLQAFSDSAVYANLTVSGNLTIFGNITTVGTTDLAVADSIINLHTAANLTAWTVNDGRDIGVKMHYYDTEDSHAFIGRENSTGFLEWITRGTEGVGNVFTGTLGTIRTGEYIAANNTPSTSTATGAVRVTGGVGIGDGLYVNGTSWFQNASTANAIITGGSVTNATGAFTKLAVTDFSSGNIYQSTAGTLVASNFSSGNIYQSAAGTLVANNFSSGNIYQSAAGTLVATNFSSGNIYQSAADTLVATNFSSPNVQMTGGQITASGTVQPSANGTVNLGTASTYWNNHYAITAFHNTVTVGAGGVTTTDGNITAVSAQTSFGNLNISGNIYQNNIEKRAIQYTTGATPHSPAQPGDQWFDTATDVLYVYHDDGTSRFWLDMIGQATPINYTASGTPPTGPRNGDLWYDTSSSILYTRVDDGDSEAWIDFSSQASPIAINSINSIIQPAFGGTGLSFLPNALIKGNGTEPVTAAVAGVDYIAPQANGVLISGNIEVGNAIVSDTITVGTVSAHNLYWDGLFQGPGGTFDALTVTGNVSVGNITVNDDIVTLGNITGNNIITTVNLVYSGNVSYDGNLNVLNVNATNVVLGVYPGVTYIDATQTAASYVDTATVDFPNFSGMLLVTNCTSGTTVMFLCGGQSATAIGASKLAADFGIVTYNASINGYTWTNNTGGTIDATFQATKTRSTA